MIKSSLVFYRDLQINFEKRNMHFRICFGGVKDFPSSKIIHLFQVEIASLLFWPLPRSSHKKLHVFPYPIFTFLWRPSQPTFLACSFEMTANLLYQAWSSITCSWPSDRFSPVGDSPSRPLCVLSLSRCIVSAFYLPRRAATCFPSPRKYRLLCCLPRSRKIRSWLYSNLDASCSIHGSRSWDK